MKPIAATLYRQIRDLHAEMVKAEQALSGDIADANLKELADTAYAMREIAAFADEVRKRANKVGEQSQRVACLVAVQTASLNDNAAEIKIKTEYCTATPAIKQIVSVPDKRKEPEAYAALMQHYGIGPELCDATSGNPLVAAYWPGIIDRINADFAAGKPTPPGIDPSKMTAEYRLSIRANKGILE